MKYKLLFLTSFISFFSICKGQVQWSTNGNNIYNPNSGNVGIGTNIPQAKLHISIPNQDNLGLIIQSNSINTDGIRHYVGLAFDGDYGNGSGNSSQIRSYSNLYANWGSSLTFHTTAEGPANTLVERMRINQNGQVGIGTSSPKAFLDVSDFSTNTLKTVLARLGEGNNYGEGTFLGVKSYYTQGDYIDGGVKSFAIEHKFYDNVNSSINFYRGGDVSGGFITFSTNNNLERMRIRANGNILIGKTSQIESRYKLDVEGPIRAHEIVVNTTGADFVFDPTYKLRPLSELETFIRKNKHLPDIAPAKEMQENGVSAGEMQAKLLQKVEELTLYVIEKDKEVTALNAEKMKQMNKIEELEFLLKEMGHRIEKLEKKSN